MNMQPVTDFLMHMLRPLYSAEYGVAVDNGKVLAFVPGKGLEGYSDFPLACPTPPSTRYNRRC